MEPWQSHSACLGAGPGLWFSDDVGDQALARSICHTCPVIVPCLDGAVRRNEPAGIWAGIDFARPHRRLQRALMSGNPIAYTAALQVALDRPAIAAGTCQRCGAPRPAGPYLPDENPPGATCGHLSTWNKGCRCDPCRDVKADADRNRRLSRAG